MTESPAIDPLRPQLIELSSRRHPFDVPPARTWRSWLERWRLSDDDFGSRKYVFWAPTAADRALAWDFYVELQTRITTQELPRDEGLEASALASIHALFEFSRTQIRQHGVACANAATLLTRYLNSEIRPFTTRWHAPLEQGLLDRGVSNNRCDEFRDELSRLQPKLRNLAAALSNLADASIESN